MTLRTLNDVATYLCDEIACHRKKEISFVSTIMNIDITEVYKGILTKKPELLLCVQYSRNSASHVNMFAERKAMNVMLGTWSLSWAAGSTLMLPMLLE